jgi:hypothetical protein
MMLHELRILRGDEPVDPRIGKPGPQLRQQRNRVHYITQSCGWVGRIRENLCAVRESIFNQT